MAQCLSASDESKGGEERIIGLLESILEELRRQTPLREAWQQPPSGIAPAVPHTLPSPCAGPPAVVAGPSPSPRPDAEGAEQRGNHEEDVDRHRSRGSNESRGTNVPSMDTINNIRLRVVDTIKTGRNGADLRELPGSVWFFLVSAAIAPLASLARARPRAVYRFYRVALAIAMVIASVRYLRELVMPIAMREHPEMYSIFAFCIQVLVTLPLWRLWRKHFGANADVMQLMQQMARQRFPWETLRASIRYVYATYAMVALGIIVKNVRFAARGLSWHVRMDGVLEPGQLRAFRVISIFFDTVGVVAQLWVTLVLFIEVWMVYFLCRLYQHDLLCYARSVKRAIEEGDSRGDIVKTMEDLEYSTTQRFRHANESWVQYVVVVLGLAATGFLVSTMSLLAQGREIGIVMTEALVCGILFLLSACLAGPLAATAETFEFDVLRDLNTPLVMQKVQKYFGQQFINHLSLLQWGFRFGGALITVGMVRNVLAAMFLAMATSVSQALFRQTKLFE